MKRFNVLLVLSVIGCALMLSGCAGVGKAMTDSASVKNLNGDGYLMLGELTTNDSETAAPTGKLIIGRITYKSRKVGISADQKVPTTGYFKSTRTKSLFGTEETIIEYDFTAGSDADSEKALKILEEKRKASETSEANKTDTSSGEKTSTESTASK